MAAIGIVVPVYNEEKILAESIGTLMAFLSTNCPHECEIVIADNGSVDRTLEIARGLAGEYCAVRVVHLDEKGRGGALKAAWAQSDADILSYMDVDLSTDLKAFPQLIAALDSGGYDLATGSRLHPEAVTRRCWQRDVISKVYNRLVKRVFGTRFSDAQCGFKAITRQAALKLLPVVQDTGWFFDTELLVLAEKYGYRIFDLPVEWTEDPDSRVKIMRTAWADLRGMVRVRGRLRRGLAPEEPEAITTASEC